MLFDIGNLFLFRLTEREKGVVSVNGKSQRNGVGLCSVAEQINGMQ